MPRIRSIKIEFFRDEDLAMLSHAHQLLFEGLWVLADRDGRLEDRPLRIHADIFPFNRDRSLDVNVMLDELAAGDNPFIVRYVVNGRRLITVINFLKHQRPHHTEPESTLPGPDRDDHLHPPDIHGVATEDIHHGGVNGENPLDQGMGNGSGSGNGSGKGGRAAPAAPADLADAWNAGVTGPVSQCQGLTAARRRKAQSRLREASLDEWRVVIARINASPFCRGANDRAWTASFDWLLQPDVRLKVLEGKYDPRGARTAPAEPADPNRHGGWKAECRTLHGTLCPNLEFHLAKKGHAA